MAGRYTPIPLDRLRELYTPDFDAGTLTAKVQINRCTPAGTVIAANRQHKADYQRITVDYDRFYLHRCLFAMATNKQPGDMIVDHVNGDTKNNCLENLRLASKSENSKNRKTWSKTGLRGVYRRARAGGGVAYEVSIHRTATVNGKKVSKTHNFGTYSCPRAAKKAYLEAIDRFGDMDYLRDGQKGDGVEAILLEEISEVSHA